MYTQQHQNSRSIIFNPRRHSLKLGLFHTRPRTVAADENNETGRSINNKHVVFIMTSMIIRYNNIRLQIDRRV